MSVLLSSATTPDFERSCVPLDRAPDNQPGRPVVGAAAATLASLSVEPIFAKFVAAAVISSGAAITNDMGHLPPRDDRCVMATGNIRTPRGRTGEDAAVDYQAMRADRAHAGDDRGI
jgi:hypothetical protein